MPLAGTPQRFPGVDHPRAGGKNERPKRIKQPQIAIYWLQGRPGAGKTFVAAHVQNILRAKKCHLAYYQFSAESRQEQGLNACLKSLAYQMALCDVSIWRKLCDLTQSSPELNLDNISLTWTTLFEKEIFQVRLKFCSLAEINAELL